MSNRETLFDLATNLLEAECLRRAADELISENNSPTLQAKLRPIDPTMLSWVLPELVQLVNEAHEQPVRNSASTIRLCLLEQSFVDVGGWADGEIQDRQDELVELLVDVLEEMRRQSIRKGRWSEMPVTPLMHG